VSKPITTLAPARKAHVQPDADEITETGASSAPVETTEALERALVRNLAAAIIGVSASLVNQWAANGGIKTNPNGDIPISEIRRKTIEWFKKNVGKRSGDDGEDAIDAKLRAERAKASLAELDLEERLAGLVSRKAASLRMVDVFTMVKTRILGMPERLSAELASKTDPRDVKEFLSKYVHEMLTDLSGDDVTTAAD
jgi:hypothetical protein